MKPTHLIVLTARLLMCLGLAACSPVPAALGSNSSPSTSSTTLFSDPPVLPAQQSGRTVSPIADWFNEDDGLQASSGRPQPEYVSPMDRASYVSKNTTIALRYGPQLGAEIPDTLQLQVNGSLSGAHAGRTVLADDQKTLIFTPDQAFTPGETVQVAVGDFTLNSQTVYPAFSLTFNIALNQQPGGVGAASKPGNITPVSAFPDALTIPQDIPHYTVFSASSAASSEGYIFVAPMPWTQAAVGDYLLILNGQGELVYYQPVSADLNTYDFKAQPDGRLSYFSQKDSTFYVLNNHYQVVDRYQAGNGYTTDLHDLQILPDGNALLMAYDAETVDMSQVVAGGKTSAQVTGLIVQELDPSKHVIFEWRSWDHVAFSDTTASLMEDKIDLVHGNALALANDGNLLLSSRNLSEITKISLKTGDVLWRLGGKANQFNFVNDKPFAFQHDIRQLPDGNITLFDNHGSDPNPAPSRGVEYQVDEVHKTVTKVWEYQPTDPQPVFATFMGDLQRLPDGNNFLDWGAASNSAGYQFLTMNEVDPNNQVVFELTFDLPYVSYRAFRAPWNGAPVTAPALAARQEGGDLTLGYSWNGATNVAAWQVYAGSVRGSLKTLEQRPKSGFETQTHLDGLPMDQCYFQVAALDPTGAELARSQEISTNSALCPLAQ